MDVFEAIEKMKSKLGSYRKVAFFLGMTEGHFLKIRTGRAHLTKKNAEFIILKAKAMNVEGEHDGKNM